MQFALRCSRASVFLVLLFLAACENVTVSAVGVTSVQVIPAEGSLSLGEHLQLSATALDSGGNPLPDREVSWSSESDSVVGVDSNGRASAHGVGSIRVVASAGDVHGYATITVSADPPEEEDVPGEEDDTPDEEGPPSATVTQIEYGTGGGPDDLRHLRITVTVRRAAGGPVANADVQIRVSNLDTGDTWDLSGSTGEDGSVQLQVNNHPSGCYATRVTSLAASGFQWDGNTPSNEYCRRDSGAGGGSGGEGSGSDGGGGGEPSPSCAFTGVTVEGDLEIGRGEECTLTGVRVRGDLEIGSGALVLAIDVRVEGNVEGEGIGHLSLVDSRVSGNVQLEDGGGAEIRSTRIDGNLELEANRGSLIADANTIDGNLQAFDNRGGPFTFTRNRIGGNLQCGGNDPAPTGSANAVDGSREGQCRGM